MNRDSQEPEEVVVEVITGSTGETFQKGRWLPDLARNSQAMETPPIPSLLQTGAPITYIHIENYHAAAPVQASAQPGPPATPLTPDEVRELENIGRELKRATAEMRDQIDDIARELRK